MRFRCSGSRYLVGEEVAHLDIAVVVGIVIAVADRGEAVPDLVLDLWIVIAWLRIQARLGLEKQSHRPKGCRCLAREGRVLLQLTLSSSVSKPFHRSLENTQNGLYNEFDIRSPSKEIYRTPGLLLLSPPTSGHGLKICPGVGLGMFQGPRRVTCNVTILSCEHDIVMRAYTAGHYTRNGT
jgi:hypothetical protein